MVEEGSYEIMPYKEIVELKKQIGELKRKTGDTSSQELLQSMSTLTKSMSSMMQLFGSAAEEMKLEEKTEHELSGKIDPLMDKVDKLEEQTRTIAEGLVAIADMVKEIKTEKRTKEVNKPMHQFKPQEKRSMHDFSSSFSSGEPELPPLEPPAPIRPMSSSGSGGLPPMHPQGRMHPQGMPPMPPPGLGGLPPMPSQGGMHPQGMPPMPPPGLGGLPPMPFSGGMDLGGLPPLPPLDGEFKKKKGLFGMFKKKK